MRTLVLIRHARAELERQDDHSRRLSPSGREDAARVRRWLSEQGLLPDRVMVSTAWRTRETWELCGVGHATPENDDRLYEASTEDVREVVGETPPDVAVLVVVGHNPALERLAWEFDDSDEARDVTNRGMSAAGVAVFELTSWTDRTGRLAAFEA